MRLSNKEGTPLEYGVSACPSSWAGGKPPGPPAQCLVGSRVAERVHGAGGGAGSTGRVWVLESTGRVGALGPPVGGNPVASPFLSHRPTMYCQ